MAQPNLSRRTALKTMALGGAAAASPLLTRFATAQTSAPIRIGFQKHATGIGASYGRWYDRTTAAAAKVINDMGGINGRPVELVIEDDGTDPKRGAEVVEKFANQHKVDVGFGTLFSHVVMGSAPRAGELKLPYFVVSEGHHVASGVLNRWTLQPGITDVKSQVLAMAPFVGDNLGKKVTMIFPDYAFGHDHRDFFTAAIEAQGGEVVAKLAIPPTETSFTKYFPKIPRETELIYHVMVGPGVLTFVKEMGEFFGPSRPEIFGFIDSLEAVDLATPGLEFLEGTYFWEGMPRYARADQPDFVTAYRDAVGVDENGASVSDPKDVSTFAHMFGCWETMFVIKNAMEACDYSGPQDRQALVEATEAMSILPFGPETPQGAKVFNGKTHQVFGPQYISKVVNSKLELVHTASLEDTFYPDEVDYTKMAF
ncbi:branched-chain amino acid ABC transporter periplasmic component-like protein [Actibacterium atlanticum]|uniref:Branched-chain amino acid ABC transporter periplasmic component-like protein n=1 Tax=Actibacterium atlanticum TaxID=1461693 RepID=A0A058ZHE1_9RHOB|nr:ABC transporter substrate-binding protein [Actibacterium atlanticum]KCV81013.1 branched-chain amino acid ABC transporter periplasmic component-like protein [Actibacterium atlanticum]